ncbi:MAG: hypothetical protein HY820_41500 [Acidobacteria bacterium]|nr:hypothetical protein [Acidobacteriota bacterium]
MSPGHENGKELTSWKEIAAFLGVSVRSAQRYETELGLPVRRLGGDKGRAVAGDVEDLVAWKKQNLAAPRFWQLPRFLRWYSIGATAVILAMSVPLVRNAVERWKTGKPHASYWLHSTLVATDQQGREVWRRGFPGLPMGGNQSRFHGDLDGDGRVETLVPYASAQRDEIGSYIHCISENGEEVWKIEPRRAVSDRRTKFTGVYVFRDYKVFPSPEKDGTQWTVATFAHHFAYPSVAVVVDGTGQTRGEYWHSGHLEWVHVADLDKDGRHELVLAGMDLGSSRAVLRVFDARNMRGAADLPEGHRNQLRGFGPGTDKATIRFARGRLNLQRNEFNYAYRIDAAPEGLMNVSVSEEVSKNQGYLIYAIRPDLSLERVSASVALLTSYREASLEFGDADLQKLRSGYDVEWRGRR